MEKKAKQKQIEQKCDKCKQNVEFLYSNNRTDDFYCEKCYNKLYGKDIPIKELPDYWKEN
jgi:hypothetical protein